MSDAPDRDVCLRALIAEAFATRQQPGPGEIAAEGPGYGGDIVTRRFSGRAWHELGFEDLSDGSESPVLGLLPYMTPEAVAYYLPAFLVAAAEIADKGLTGASDEEYAFADSLCFFLTEPSPTSLADQYEFVKDLPEVPDDIKAYLRDPSPEAKRTEAEIYARHRRLLEILVPEERAVIRATLERLVALLTAAPLDEVEYNNAARALATTWGGFGTRH